MPDTYIKDLESVANGLIERYNVVGLAPAVGAYKHVTAKRIGPANDPSAFELEISGMLALDEQGNLVGEDCKQQTLKIIDNIATAVRHSATQYGMVFSKKAALEHITSTMVLLGSMDDFPKVNEAYTEGGMPLGCRAAFAAKDLPLSGRGVLVEIRVNAYLPGPSNTRSGPKYGIGADA